MKMADPNKNSKYDLEQCRCGGWKCIGSKRCIDCLRKKKRGQLSRAYKFDKLEGLIIRK